MKSGMYRSKVSNESKEYCVSNVSWKYSFLSGVIGGVIEGVNTLSGTFSTGTSASAPAAATGSDGLSNGLSKGLSKVFCKSSGCRGASDALMGLMVLNGLEAI